MLDGGADGREVAVRLVYVVTVVAVYGVVIVVPYLAQLVGQVSEAIAVYGAVKVVCRGVVKVVRRARGYGRVAGRASVEGLAPGRVVVGHVQAVGVSTVRG